MAWKHIWADIRDEFTLTRRGRELVFLIDLPPDRAAPSSRRAVTGEWLEVDSASDLEVDQE